MRPLMQVLASYLANKWKGDEDDEKIETIFDYKYFFIAEISIVWIISIAQSYFCLKALKNFRRNQVN